MPAGRHGDLAELAAGGPAELHVTTGHWRVELHRRERPHRHLELADDAELRHLANTGADPAARGPVAAERDQDVTADARRDHREGALHAGGGHPTDAFAAFCGQLRVGWHFCEPADPQAKGVVERLQGYLETSFEPGRAFANHLDFQDQLDRWFSERANCRLHRTLRRRPVELLAEEHEAMRPLPERAPDTERRWVLRVPADPHVRLDTNDYSLDPNLVGRRVEVRASQREVTAVALDTGELACRHERSFAKNRTITALEHARALRERRGEPEPDVVVEQRPLAVYDRLIA